MGKQEVPKPLLIALLVVVVGAGLMFLKNKGQEAGPAPAPVATPTTAPTGATAEPPKDKPPSLTTRKKRRTEKLKDEARKAGLPFDVFMARRANKIVVIFFVEPKGLVDKRVTKSLAIVKSKRGNMVVFRDNISNTSRYSGIADAADVSGTPAIILLYRDRAELVSGYIDWASLNERVAQIVAG